MNWTEIREKTKTFCADHLGFLPSVMATFDHVTAGLPSRILVGYEKLAQTFPEDVHAASFVLDTVLPSREKPCGTTLELEIISEKQSPIVKPDVFFFRNTFSYNFKRIQEQLPEVLERYFPGTNRVKTVTRDVIAYRLYKIANLWRPVTSCMDILDSRARLSQELGLTPFVGRTYFHSETLPMFAAVIDLAVRSDIPITRCIGISEHGALAREILPDGREGQLITDIDKALAKIATRDAIPVAPLTILAMILIGTPHFGNDYDMINSISNWLNLPHELRLTQHCDNSWPVGSITRKGRDLNNAFIDLLHFPQEMYADKIRAAVAQNGPAFHRRFGDVVVF